MSEPLNIAVVGHTNHGKTSLIRTLTWTGDFGEVADRRAVTRRVEWIDIADEHDQPLLRLFDTPGLENSIELRDAIESIRSDTREDGVDLIERFLADSRAAARFPQPAKALQQMLGSDVIVNVIDARQRTLSKYRDELEILRWANPRIVNVLNFTSRPNALCDDWRELLTRGGFGYIASFDVVALHPDDEVHLLDTIGRLVAQTPGEAMIKRFTSLRAEQWSHFRTRAVGEAAEMLIDVAAFAMLVPRDTDLQQAGAVVRRMQQAVRNREQRCYQAILEQRGMADASDERRAVLDLPDAGWQADPFDRARLVALAKMGGSGVAAGAMAGAVFDVAAAGLTFGIGTATGAILGGALGAARTGGRNLRHRLNQVREMTVNNEVVVHLADRQLRLIDHLLRRGHAAQRPVEDSTTPDRNTVDAEPMLDTQTIRTLQQVLVAARNRAGWSTLGDDAHQLDDSRRMRTRDRLAELLENRLDHCQG